MDESNKLLGKTFIWMFIGLLTSGVVAWVTYETGLVNNIIFNDFFGILLVIELVAVFVFSILFHKLSYAVVTVLYFIYAFLNGLTLSTIFVAYQLDSVVYLFFVSAFVFAVLGFLGYKTKSNLSSWQTYLLVFLLAGIIISLINLFLIKSSMLDLVLDWGILVLFFAITVYDINKIKNFDNGVIPIDKLHIYCAMDLYLDFVNIFLRILSLFGNSKD